MSNLPETELFAALEAEIAFHVCTGEIEERLRSYGVAERAHERAILQPGIRGRLPDLPHCRLLVYREVIPGTVIEVGGGIQIEPAMQDIRHMGGYAVRVPVYTLNEEGRIRPVGGAFDDIDHAEMVAAQVQDVDAYASEHGMALSDDLTAMTYEDRSSLVIIHCAPPDSI